MCQLRKYLVTLLSDVVHNAQNRALKKNGSWIQILARMSIAFTEKGELHKIWLQIKLMNMTWSAYKSIIKPLLINYKKRLEKGCFLNEWKKANVLPVHKKMTNSYQISISNLRKVLQRLVYNSIFGFFIQLLDHS